MLIKPLASRLRISEKQLPKLQKSLEDESWLYSSTRWKRMFACYLYSMIGHVFITAPICVFLYLVYM